ncbi:hypothetical protein [uncultured Bartonella sp.]|uniref:hypothetical protein n=1 Tax=uncultured Bartonella sp. TaxID=104108 RepID=UPI0025E04CA6|nr:hypothetical protein [uncultured Bartonella sp.]
MKPVVAAFIMCLTLCSYAFAQEGQNNDKTVTAPAEATATAPTEQTKAPSEAATTPVEAPKVESNQQTEHPSPTQNTPAEPSGKPMSFSLHTSNEGQCPTCRWISAEGNIVPDTPASFNRFLEENKLSDPLSTPNGLLISFHSNGGDILAAIALGREIRKHDFDTTVGNTIVRPLESEKPANQDDDKSADKADSKADDKDKNDNNPASETQEAKTVSERTEGICREACIWAFLGGRARNVNNGKLELRTYRPPLDGAGTTSGQEVSVRQQQLADIAYIADYSEEMGFNPVIAFINWDNADSHIFSSDEIRNYSIDFSPDVIGKWQLAPINETLVAIASSNDKKTSARLYCDSHKTMFLEISGPTRYSAESYQNYQQTVQTLQIWGMSVGINQVQTNLSEGRVVYTIELPKSPLQDWHVDAPFLKGDNVAEPLKGIFNIEFSDMPGLKQAARFVMNNCPSASR